MTAKVSVILPAFNSARTVKAAVNSILGQSFTDFELLVFDDGSSDNTSDIIMSLNDSRIRLIKDDINKGLTARLNEGVSMAQGIYIARMDADDVAFPDRFSKQVSYLDSHPDIDLLAGRALVFADKTYEAIGLLPFAEGHKEITRKPWSGIHMPHPTWMGRTDWFRKNPYREVARAEDQDLLLRAIPHSKYACLPDVLLGYRAQPYSLSRTLIARKSLWQTKTEIFIKRREWRYALLTSLASGLKITLDALASLPGLSQLFFLRMQGATGSKADMETLASLLREERGQ